MVNRSVRSGKSYTIARDSPLRYHEELVAFYQAISGSLDREDLWNEAVEVTRTALEVDRQVWSSEAATKLAHGFLIEILPA